MRIALCLSGQPRYLEEGLFFLNKFFLSKYKIDVFIHTWWDQSYVGKEFLNTGLERDGRYDDKTIEKLKIFYKPIKMTVEEEKDFGFFSSELFKQQDKDFDFFTDMNYGGAHPISPYSMYYSIKKCNELKKDYEIENKFSYDLVIRTRFDIAIRSFELDLENIDNSLIYVAGEHHYRGFLNFSNDCLAISSSENMDYYASLFDNMSRYRDLGQGNICFSGEGLLKGHLYDFGKKSQYFCTNEELFVMAWWDFSKIRSSSLYQECLEFKQNLKLI